MSGNIYSTGLRSVGAYQVSGHPFLTGSTLTGNAAGLGGVNGEDKIQFPYVSKSIVITCGTLGGGQELKIAFAPKGTGNVVSGKHFLTLDTAGDSVTLNVKCKEVYLFITGTGGSDTANYELFAELTNIPTGSMYDLTGVGITT